MLDNETSHLNLGCGRLYREGWINVDVSQEVKADYYLDVTKGLDIFPDNSMIEVHSGCMIEQISDNEDFKFVLNEIWRVLKPDGVFNGYVPTPDPRVMFLDPMDKRFFRPETFDYFNVDKHSYQEFGKIYGFKPWRNIETEVNESGILHFKMTK